jgi:hypothetical protein
VKEAEQDRSAVVQSPAGKAKDAVKRSEAFGTEVADHGSLVPRPGPFDRIEVRGVGWEPNECEPMRLVFGELASGDTSVRGDAVPDHDDGPGQVLVKLPEKLDHVLRTDRPGNQSKKETGPATLRGVGRSSNRGEVLPVAEAMV